jgi:hypothetical protein
MAIPTKNEWEIENLWRYGVLFFAPYVEIEKGDDDTKARFLERAASHDFAL